ncbi:MAG: CHAT domain-containing protein [Deltaproteobacteria bacterium]|nr:CHAT domain-containing protein [Deltaproteobacteria bacterium]
MFIKPDLSPDQVRLFDAFAAACRVARFPENIVSRVGGHPYLLQLLYSQLRRGEMSREAVAHLEQIVFGEGKRLVERGVEVLRNHANNGVRGDIEQVLRDIEQGGVATIVGNLRAALLLYSAGILRPELASDNTLTFGCRNGVAMDSVMREIGRKPRSSRIPITPRMQSIEIEGISAHSCGLCEAPAQVTISFETVGNDYCPPWRLPRYFVDVDGFNDRLNGIREILNDRESNPGGEREFTRLHNLLVGMVPRDLWDRAKAGADTYITTNLVEVPWELLPVRLRDKDDFGNQIMGLVCPVGRAIRTVSISSLQVEPKPMNRSKGAPLKALVVGGGRSHPDNIEVEEVCNALVSIGFEKKNIDVHKGYDWPRWMADTIDKGKRRQYDVFHLVAHGSESLQDARHAGLDHALGCLRLTRDTYISADGIRHLLELVAFRFAFVNVCHAASQVSLGNFSPVYNLLQKGTMVVAPLWAVAATDAAEFATHFYFGLQDHTVGEAIRRTRLHVAQNPSGKRALNNFWASYVLYGDPRIDLLR